MVFAGAPALAQPGVVGHCVGLGWASQKTRGVSLGSGLSDCHDRDEAPGYVHCDTDFEAMKAIFRLQTLDWTQYLHAS
ncbi:hypothetical protein NSPZN2_40483 [Nitrospira defluvii]|uniref:Secreted protein n=1 Tax=Nitrospira defluvii TaxID=330214 RepID=A0ABM8RW30_9BACT|nr:hypothetical protein NSPZN2_40483 [Nitrospira defluvii]